MEHPSLASLTYTGHSCEWQNSLCPETISWIQLNLPTAVLTCSTAMGARRKVSKVRCEWSERAPLFHMSQADLWNKFSPVIVPNTLSASRLVTCLHFCHNRFRYISVIKVSTICTWASSGRIRRRKYPNGISSTKISIKSLEGNPIHVAILWYFSKHSYFYFSNSVMCPNFGQKQPKWNLK